MWGRLHLAGGNKAPPGAVPRATPPLLDLRAVRKTYGSGEAEVHALSGIDLQIRRGEFVAIVGASGSGKSTLMHIIGCLDRPTSGSYRIAGRDVSKLSADDLATLRGDTFGFVFQRYNLLADATALENVEIPAIYAGRAKPARRERAIGLLTGLGLADRLHHRPSQLSGGEQQRVSIGRALMNDPDVILADEPTGALDSRNGKEVLELLRQLHAEGRTILLVTHDPSLAEHAERIVQLHDGRILADIARGNPAAVRCRPTEETTRRPDRRSGLGLAADIPQATVQAFRSLRVNPFRTILTLLGVVIGVAAVVAVVAIGSGTTQDVMQEIEAMGTNVLTVRPGAPGTRTPGDIATLLPGDAEAIANQPNVDLVAPTRAAILTLRAGNIDYRTRVQGTWPGFLAAGNWTMSDGAFFTGEDLRGYAPVAVLGSTVAENLFPHRPSPLGEYVLVRNVPFEVIGVLAPKGAALLGGDMDDMVVVPLSTAFMRLFGQRYLNSITIQVGNAEQIASTQAELRHLLLARHQTEDFQIRNPSAVLDTAESVRVALTLFLGSAGLISLLVGGIGVMNIMLVSVSERTREIGIRMAAGARARNILLQFNTEAVVVCGIGGVLGILFGLAIVAAVSSAGISIAVSPTPPLLAFSCAFVTGVLFGFLPARKASRLDPVAALASE